MGRRLFLFLNSILLVFLLAAGGQSSVLGYRTQTNPAYLEPGLAVQSLETISVIVSAQSSDAAAKAVQQVGGQVTSELWLIDSVAARLPLSQLSQLTKISGVRSIVENKSMTAAGKLLPKKPTPTPISKPTEILIQQSQLPTLTPTSLPTSIPTQGLQVLNPTPTSMPTLKPTKEKKLRDLATTAIPEIVSGSSTDNIQVSLDENGWVTDFRFPVPWDGSPDVQQTDQWTVIKQVYPTVIDIGGDHLGNLTGAGVTVAIVDSGVSVSPLVNAYLGQEIGAQFLGQADFVDAICSTFTINKEVKTNGVQYPDYCLSSIYYSQDPYGHGTHIAGTIWNNQTESQTGLLVGVAPNATILSVRVLGPDGSGSYESVIKGIQYVVANQTRFNIRVLNLSLSANPTTPYFIDPLNRAVEAAWAAGIVVVAAAGNNGPSAETITVPGNDPYVITVGALDGVRTPGYWADDSIPSWSGSGPTLDGFVKPDLVAPGTQVVSFMLNSFFYPADSANLALQHPDYSLTQELFRMNGTSMAAAVTSGAVALLLQARPNLTPDQVKYRLMFTAPPMGITSNGLARSPLQQGTGRLWLPDAIGAEFEEGNGNQGMDLTSDLNAGWGYLDEAGNPVFDFEQLSHHYLGPVSKSLSDDGKYFLYFVENSDNTRIGLGVTSVTDNTWQDIGQVAENTSWTMNTVSGGESGQFVWTNGVFAWNSGPLFDASGRLVWSGGYLFLQNDSLIDPTGRLVWSGSDLFDASGRLVWSGGSVNWEGGSMIFQSDGGKWTTNELFDDAGRLVWSGGRLVWSGSELLDATGWLVWSGGDLFDASGRLVWSGGRLVWSGSQLLDASGRLVWSGGRLVWSGSQLLDASGRLVWSGRRLVWSGGRLVWSGSQDWTRPFNSSNSFASSTKWVEW